MMSRGTSKHTFTGIIDWVASLPERRKQFLYAWDSLPAFIKAQTL